MLTHSGNASRKNQQQEKPNKQNKKPFHSTRKSPGQPVPGFFIYYVHQHASLNVLLLNLLSFLYIILSHYFMANFPGSSAGRASGC